MHFYLIRYSYETEIESSLKDPREGITWGRTKREGQKEKIEKERVKHLQLAFKLYDTEIYRLFIQQEICDMKPKQLNGFKILEVKLASTAKDNMLLEELPLPPKFKNEEKS